MMASYKLGVNAYVVKPVDFYEFVNAIKELGVFRAIINDPTSRKRKEVSIVRKEHAAPIADFIGR